MTALEGLRVLELGHGIAGPFAGRLLGDLGADVIKVESPAGDRLRREPPLLRDGGDSVVFELVNWNKRGVRLDLGERTAAAELDALVARADVVITSLRPRRLRAWGLDGAALLARNPRLVAVSVTSFGATGPDRDLAASDLVLQARSGLMAISGSAERHPLKHGLRTSLWGAGLNAAYAALAGVLAVRRTGAGVEIDLSIHECLASQLVMNHADRVFGGAVQGRPPESPDPLDGNPLPAGDGHLALQTSARQPIARLAELFGDERLADPRFATPEGRVEHADELRAVLAAQLAGTSARELFLRASGAGLLSGVVQGAGDLLACEQLAARGAFTELSERAPDGRPWRLPATLAALSRTPTSVRRRAPRHGEHDAEVRRELAAAAPTAPERPRPAGAGAPLAGLRVIDLSIIFAVPYLGALLADLGAEVIKVEAPARMDQTRTDWGGYIANDPGEEPWNRSGTFHVVNRGKRSLALDLGTEAGRAVLRRLLATADVLLDNFTPRVLRKWGMTYEELRPSFPRLIGLSNTGYGSTGPWRDFKAQGTTLEATMGLMAVTGYAGGAPARAGQSVPDFFACWTGLVALLAALLERERSGLGQHIDLGMYQLGPAMVPEALLHRQATGEDPVRAGARDAGDVLSDVVRCGDGRWLAVSGPRERIARITGTGDLAAWAAAQPSAAAVADALQALRIAASPVHDAATLLADPHLRARGFHEPVRVPGVDAPVPLIGRPFRWASAASTVGVRGPGPRFGEANADVLERLLRLPETEIAALYRAGVVTDAPVAPPPARAMDVDALLAAGVLAHVERDAEAIA